MKSYTDVEQSKMLAEILPLDSADMHYHYDFDFDELESIPTITEEDDHFILFPDDVRCWSLAALLNVIPKHIKDHNVLRIDINENDFAIWYDEIGYGVNRELPDLEMKEPIDACVEMIIKLHEQKLL